MFSMPRSVSIDGPFRHHSQVSERTLRSRDAAGRQLPVRGGDGVLVMDITNQRPYPVSDGGRQPNA